MCGWVLTLIIAGITAGIIAALFVYSPNKLSADDRVFANQQLNQVCGTVPAVTLSLKLQEQENDQHGAFCSCSLC